MIGKTPLQALDLWMAEADRQGLYILLDFHSVSMQRQYPTWFVVNPADFGLVYNKQAYTVENWTRDLAFVARRYANLDHFLGIDVYNEPNGVVRWSTGDANAGNPIYFWKAAAERASAAVLAANPKLLVFVQGINGNFDGRENSNVPMNWGEDFQPQAYQPLDIPDDKLVLSPHTYGPDVYMKSSFSASNFPANLAAHWDTLFGQFHQKHSIVIGEWGGRYGNGSGGQMDAVWQNAFVDYLISKGLRNGFYWSYTPNSGDTGGILDDNLNVRQDKLALLKRLWGNAAETPPVSPPSTTPPPASPPPTARPVPSTLPSSHHRQPSIAHFSPASGPPGTVVTVHGSGFAGAHLAWIGAARNAAVNVIGDTQLRVTIPAGATSGAIGIFNPAFAAFTATWFTVRGSSSFVQPSIDNFSPSAGPAGTVVTLTGSGFNGANLAWTGAARNAAAHELRGPLAPMASSLALMRLASDDADQVAQACDVMERQLGLLVRLVDDLVDVDRIRLGKVRLRIARTEVADVIRGAAETSWPMINARGHDLALELPTSPMAVNADATRLAQVVSNLLNNAAKYTERNGKIRLSVEQRGEEILIAVKDDGAGISALMLPKVFDLFTQADRSLGNAQSGLGLGLHIIKRLVELHGGSVAARSDGEGRGSEFVVMLPVARPVEQAIRLAGEHAGPSQRDAAASGLEFPPPRAGADYGGASAAMPIE